MFGERSIPIEIETCTRRTRTSTSKECLKASRTDQTPEELVSDGLETSYVLVSSAFLIPIMLFQRAWDGPSDGRRQPGSITIAPPSKVHWIALRGTGVENSNSSVLAAQDDLEIRNQE